VRDDDGHLLGAMPLYVKYDSRGEFVFDWSWADAFESAGLDYYPKLVSAVPFTPATGPRLLTLRGADRNAIAQTLLAGVQTLADDIEASTAHILFPDTADRGCLADSDFLPRKGCQFHWTNDGYADFDDFLSRFSSAKRKKVKRERRRIAEQNISFDHLQGDEPSPPDWDAIFQFYARSFLRRGRRPYLTREFFDEIATTMPENLVIVLARYEAQPIATAICLRSENALYGRYWGSLADFHSLHFETCYYQGIDYCIREKLQLFEPGTQGEHKISRGFRPTETWSFHWIRDDEFRAAIEEFLDRETQYVDDYMQHLDGHVPYRKDPG
jgi:predicted N-acyltransferase